jgi:hypothetical protein
LSALLVALASGCNASGEHAIREGSSLSSISSVLRGRGTSYALDAVTRDVPPKGSAPACPKEDLVTYRGTNLRYDAPVTVHRAFPDRLARFETIAKEVGIEVFGRAPKTLHSGGAFACRTTKSGRYLSEHALGNALDVEGFSFEPIAKNDLGVFTAKGGTLDARARGAVRVRVGSAWRDGGSPLEKQFFARLLERLRAEDDVFRAMIGPPDPSHVGHLHFDVGQWAYARYQDPRS